MFRGFGQFRLTPLLFIAFLASRLPAVAQDAAMVSFTLNFPGSEPDHYAISVSSNGHATYDSTGKLRPDVQDSEPFHLEFAVSAPTRSRIFDLARRAHFFQGEIDSNKKNLASTGTKTLVYKDPQRTTQATYNYSSVPAVQQLTQLFQGLSTTLEFGRRLEYFHRYQKLALDEELKRMDEMAKNSGLVEIPAIGLILQQIASDSSVINADRARAQRLLAMAGSAR
jgi:hypothetical protein